MHCKTSMCSWKFIMVWAKSSKVYFIHSLNYNLLVLVDNLNKCVGELLSKPFKKITSILVLLGFSVILMYSDPSASNSSFLSIE